MRSLEFYSGVGGMRFALRRALRELNPASQSTASYDDNKEDDDGVVCAFDVNLIANKTYEHNFHKRRRKLPHQQQQQRRRTKNNKAAVGEDATVEDSSRVCSLGIDYLTPEDLDRHRADLWMLSPPCQPYTSLGLQKGSEDSRANSFLHLMTEVLPRMKHKPTHLLVENVPGFEASDTHQQLVTVLSNQGYEMEQFLLSPTQFGIPNHRLRYYLIATLKNKKTKNNNEDANDDAPNNTAEPTTSVKPVLNYLPGCSNCVITPSTVRPLVEFLETNLSSKEEDEAFYSIPKKFFKANHYKFDIASIETTTAVSCFTKGYGKTWRGAGPLLWKLSTTQQPSLSTSTSSTSTSTSTQTQTSSSAQLSATITSSISTTLGEPVSFQSTVSPAASSTDASIVSSTDSLVSSSSSSSSLLFAAPEEKGLPQDAAIKIRLFTPREIANLLCFPPEFDFPPSMTVVQQYRLLGNSLNVLVVSEIIKYMLR